MPQLEFVIQDLLAAAEAAAPNAARTRLNGGLTINLRKDGGSYVLTLWRKNTYPSIREWNIVCAHFPYEIPLSTPNRNIHQDKYYLQNRIPAHPKVTGVPQL